jgi:hypothetical protein
MSAFGFQQAFVPYGRTPKALPTDLSVLSQSAVEEAPDEPPVKYMEEKPNRQRITRLPWQAKAAKVKADRKKGGAQGTWKPAIHTGCR